MLEIRFQSINNELDRKEMKLVDRINMSIERRVPCYFEIKKFDFKFISKFYIGAINNFSISNQSLSSRFKMDSKVHEDINYTEFNTPNHFFNDEEYYVDRNRDGNHRFNINPILMFLKREYFSQWL